MTRSALISSFSHAFRGLKHAWKEQRNFRIEIIIALMAVGLGLWLRITRLEWAAVLLCIGMVLALELINSALENLLDKLHPEIHPMIGKAKDTAAAAVLIAAIISLLVGFSVFYVRISAFLAD